VLVTNHPAAGGSHLPDITVITPVFNVSDSGSSTVPSFYVASRGHHADIGGTTPGSMPSDSQTLVEEGAVIHSFKLVSGGVFQEEGITEVLMAPAFVEREPTEQPLSGCRNLPDVLSDLKAQVAANSKGILLLRELMTEYGEPLVKSYMEHVQVGEESVVHGARAGRRGECENA
jgi:5-oxoprolinase (ATP-hydrolysing)